MPDQKARRERKKYSVYRLDSCPKTKNPNSPDAPWSPVAFFDSDNDATIAGRLLGELQGPKSPHYSITREIREKEIQPKSSRRIV